MGSSRLPGKVLADLAGAPLLERIIRRVVPAKSIDLLVVATTHLQTDDPIAALAHRVGVPCFRGEEHDCLDRYYQAALEYEADVVVRLTGDNPLVDAGFVDWMVESFLQMTPACDYGNAGLSATFPYGLSVELFSCEALEIAWREGTDAYCREHVTPFLEQHPERFRIWSPVHEPDLSHLRWTVDTVEDLERMRRIYALFRDEEFTWQDVVSVLQQHSELAYME
jgi:spore coat polysaccharide biosynthesis protein SpsF